LLCIGIVVGAIDRGIVSILGAVTTSIGVVVRILFCRDASS
jgi:hypothetical protein